MGADELVQYTAKGGHAKDIVNMLSACPLPTPAEFLLGVLGCGGAQPEVASHAEPWATEGTLT